MSKLGNSGKAAAVAIALTAGGSAQAAEVINMTLSDVLANGQSVESAFDISSFLTGANGGRYKVASASLTVQGNSPYGFTNSVITGYGGGRSCGWFSCYYYSYPIYSGTDGFRDTLLVSLGEINSSAVTQATSYYGNYYGNLVANLVLGAPELASLNSSGRLLFSSSATTNTSINLSGASLTFELASISAVPEPATWGLMMLGFGAVGATMRSPRNRRKRVALA